MALTEKPPSLKIRFLHISDLHFTDPGQPGAGPTADNVHAGIVTASLLRTIGELKAAGEVFDFIIMTGDLASKGQKAEYQAAEAFIGKLLACCGLDNQLLFLVPGNHDLDRGEIKPAHHQSFYSFTTESQITDIITDSDLFPILMRKFARFNDFANRMMGAVYFSGSSLFYVQPVVIRKNSINLTLNLVGLNSALFAGYDGDDKQRLAFGLQQVTGATARLNRKGCLSIGFFHHPVECMHEADETARNILVRDLDLLLTGHRHKAKALYSIDAAGQAVFISAGAGYEERQSCNSFNIIEVDLATGAGKVRPFKYLADHDLWKPDTDTYPHTGDGHFPFQLQLKAPQPLPGPAEPDLPARYLRWVHDWCGFISIKGIRQDQEEAYTFKIDELYIPLQTTDALPGLKTGSPKQQPDHPGKVKLERILTEKKIIIIGDPGAGKTTFLRRTAYLLTGRLLGILEPEKKGGELNLACPLFIRLEELTAFISQSRKQQQGDYPVTDTDPAWFPAFLLDSNQALNGDLSPELLTSLLAAGKIIFLLDGLDEAPTVKARERICQLIGKTVSKYPQNTFIVTCRPNAYKEDVVLKDFYRATIAPLEEESINNFLAHWSKALHRSDPAAAEKNYLALRGAIRSSNAIKRMALNPVMLTALAVIHLNAGKLPEQRAELYEAVIYWLLKSRKNKANRVNWQICALHLQKLALAMQQAPEGRQTEAGRSTAVDYIYQGFSGLTAEIKKAKARQFLEEEEIDSGVIVSRGRGQGLAFWHLTFQEYLAAKELVIKDLAQQRDLLINEKILYNPAWKEVLLLFGGICYRERLNEVDKFFAAILDTVAETTDLAGKAKCIGLLGAMVHDLAPYAYKLEDPRYFALRDQVMSIFAPEQAQRIALDIRVKAADVLGQIGDPRLKEDNWLLIPACSFQMGAQKKDPKGLHYDKDAYGDEAPVHEVRLSAYKIGRYPVTVGEFNEFILAEGYQTEKYWQAGGFAQFAAPEGWESQELFPSRPVTGVSWFEAMAYAAWNETDLPTEAQWERAARGAGRQYKKYPWGDQDPDGKIANSSESGLGHSSPVGIFPGDCTDEMIFDMGGNVREWCRDWKDGDNDDESDFYKKSTGALNPVNDQKGTWGIIGAGKYRIVRGGSWGGNNRCDFRCACRNNYLPAARNIVLGFRVVLRSLEI